MNKRVTLFLLISFFIIRLQAQYSGAKDSSFIISLNQQIDDHVVANDTAALSKLYAEDFVFSHGSGKIEGKKGWFVSVVKGSFISRQHDSVTVELHPSIAIVRGKLSVIKKKTPLPEKYHLKYIRVYALRNNQWQLISHITTHEYHEQ